MSGVLSSTSPMNLSEMTRIERGAFIGGPASVAEIEGAHK
jgi:hypothetical protein